MCHRENGHSETVFVAHPREGGLGGLPPLLCLKNILGSVRMKLPVIFFSEVQKHFILLFYFTVKESIFSSSR